MPKKRTSPPSDAPVQRSFRLSGGTLERLDRRARERGQSANALAARLIEEGLRAEDHPLVYFRDGGSDRHLRDVGGVLQVSGSEVDRGYIASWAETLGVSDVWQRVLEELATRNRR